MDFATSTKPRPAENIVPMINVVFLLLIFFLMSAQIAPPAPTELDLPNSASDTPPKEDDVLYLTQDGVAHFAGLEGPLALSALAQAAPGRITLHADAALPAAEFAVLLRQFGSWGISQIDVITDPR